MLKFLGKGSAFNPELGNTSAFLNYGNDFILIDCGGEVFSKIKKLKLLKHAEKVYIVITHTHGDHVGSLGDLVLYLHHMKNIKPTIIFPNKHKLQQFLKLVGVSKELYSIHGEKEFNCILDNKKIEIKWIKTFHTGVLNSFGYLFYFPEKNYQFYYSGDTKKIPESIIEMFEKGQIDRIYQDVSSIKFEGHPHLFIGDLELKIEDLKQREKIYCMHFDEYLDEEKIKKLGFNVVDLY